MRGTVWLAVSVAIAITGCIHDGEGVRRREDFANDIYRTVDGSSGIECFHMGADLECGVQSYLAREQTFSVESVHTDCSSQGLRCIANLVDVFAVPESGLKPGAIFHAGDAEVGVERCYDEHDEACSSALLYTICKSERCREILGDGERVGYFFYDTERGVTAFTATNRRLRADEGALSLEFLGSMFVLTQPKGFLARPLALSRRDK